MIGVARQNGRGPINLFQKHDANHLVRPGRGAERQTELGHAPQIGRKSVRAADRKNSAGGLFVPPAAEMPGQSGAVEIVATLIERHQHGFIGIAAEIAAGLLGHPGRGVAGAAFGDFMNIEAAKAEFAADVIEALAVAFGQFPLRTLLQPADEMTTRRIGEFPAECMPSDLMRRECPLARQKNAKSIHAHSLAMRAVMRSTVHRRAGSDQLTAVGLCVHNLSRL